MQIDFSWQFKKNIGRLNRTTILNVIRLSLPTDYITNIAAKYIAAKF